MSSSDVAESQEAIIKTLKEGGAQLNGDVHTHTNGHSSNGVDSVDGGAGSKPAAPTTPEEGSTPKSEDAPVVTNEEAPTPKNEVEHTSKSEEAPTPKNEVEHTSKGEEAPTHRSEDAPVVKNEEEPTPKNDVEHSSKSEEAPTHRSEDAPVVTNETPKSDDNVPSLRVEPATPNSEDGLSLKGEEAAAPKNEEAAPAPEKPSEANHKPEVATPPLVEDRAAPAPAPAAASRSPKKEWFTKRQSSQEMKKEVEVQSRPTISKASMSTSVDEKSVRAAYEDVRADTTDTEWAVFKFQDQNVVCSATGVGFDSFRSNFKEDDRAFGFIRIQMGDEMSKRQKFVFITWVGPDVSVIRRAKMSIDKAMVKNIVKTFAVELQLESLGDINVEYFREQLARAGGANYGTGVRA